MELTLHEEDGVPSVYRVIYWLQLKLFHYYGL